MKLEPGTPAPYFEARDESGKIWTLTDLKGKPAILYFYPADDTPGCTMEACDFRDNLHDFMEAGYTVLGVSGQDAGSHRAFIDKYGLNFPLLVDTDLTLAEAYGVRRERGYYKDIPLDVKRSTFVIDQDGNIAEALYAVDAGGHVADLKAKLLNADTLE